MIKKICLYYYETPLNDRWFQGDRYLRNGIKYILGRKPKISSLQKVFNHLCLGFDKINIKYTVNQPFESLENDDIIIILGRGRECLRGYHKSNSIIAGIGLMTHPSEWPDLFTDYPVKVYLQHSEWTRDIYKKHYKNSSTWFTGINTDEWNPQLNISKSNDVLIYDKIMFDRDQRTQEMLIPIEAYLQGNNISYKKITYGSYSSQEFKKLLNRSKAMIFLCEHESQGLAYQEALAMNVPIFAWQQGFWLDPNRFKFGELEPVPAASVPFFDERCGITFKNREEFYTLFPLFYKQVIEKKFNAREYILENLTLEKSAQRMLQIITQYISD